LLPISILQVFVLNSIETSNTVLTVLRNMVTSAKHSCKDSIKSHIYFGRCDMHNLHTDS